MFDPDAFSDDFQLAQASPEPSPDTEDPTPEDGPWISHGTVHLGRKPNH